ncbi:MAG: hypothetical protein QHH18_06905 [Candidatus Bathyarchaeota archaeon]|jgi:sulfur relay (sulfurtransferase) DsrC/TusE family protein|nr:hypothetical protein [Candidatus Bathyarchaeota archaeon A05DMB-5]MDH7558311.1 hypothetical protein [Candidatus Bathyarchaeota archaeon]
MSEEKEKRKEKEDVEELREVLSVVSKEIPSLIKGIVASVFSEEAGRDMGKAAAAFYKELKEAGMPEETAVKMTENYVAVFTSLGEILKRYGMGGEKHMLIKVKDEEIGEEISRKIKEKLAEKRREREEEEEDED